VFCRHHFEDGSEFEQIHEKSTVVGIMPQLTAIETVPPKHIVVAPKQSKKRGSPSKAPRSEARTSSNSPVSMLGLSLRVAPTMQFDLRLEEEGILWQLSPLWI